MTELNENSFTEEVENSPVPVLVDFWAPWCGPCRAQTPILETLAQEVRSSVKIAKVNVDEEENLARKFGVMSIPTLIVFKGGKPAAKAVGLHSLNDLKRLIEA